MDRAERERVDVVIVGAGAAGCLFAQRFARAGKRVVLLESGPLWQPGELYSSGIWNRQLKPPDGGAESTGVDRVFAAYHQGLGAGGAAMHHGAVWIRMREEDFETRSRFGWSVDWPIRYDDVRPFYDRFQTEAGISGDAEQEIWRPPGEPYPLPALPWTRQAELLATGFAAHDLPVAPIPLGIISRPYHGRTACLSDGWCESGCPTGALANPHTLHLADALRQGAELRTDSTVTRLIASSDGSGIDAVEYVDRRGEAHRQHADLVILAASTVQNPRLLLFSTDRHHPDGLANRSGYVGKGIMVHPVQTIFGLHAEPTDPTLGYNGGCVLNQSDYSKAERGSSYQWLGAPSMKLNDMLGIAPAKPHLYGESLHRFIRDAAHHLISLTALGEDRARDENRLTLLPRRDRFGIPIAAIDHALHDADRSSLEFAAEQGMRIMQATGAREVWRGEPWHFHILGGARMGSDPATSVTDSYGRCHDLRNLIIAGGSLFPTVGAINPTLTLYALADRTAGHLLGIMPADA
jgi:choline dehydrogenase-like flavoprotein